MNAVAFPSLEWFERWRAVVNADAEYRELARYFTARFQLGVGGAIYQVETVRGEMVAVRQGEPLEGYDFALAGPVEEWERLVRGEADLAQATNAAHGRLRLRGNVVAAAGNMWALYNLCARFPAVEEGETAG